MRPLIRALSVLLCFFARCLTDLLFFPLFSFACFFRSRYAAAFDRVYLSQFQVGCINETASARATAEAKKQLQPPATAVVDKINGVASAAAASTSAAASSADGPDSLPLNKLLRPQAIITVETVKSVVAIHSALVSYAIVTSARRQFSCSLLSSLCARC